MDRPVLRAFASARSAPCARRLSSRAAGHQRCAGRLGRGLIRRRGDRCEQYSRRITHTAAKYKGRNYGVITGQSNYDSNYPDEKWRRAPLLWEEAPITGRSHRGEYATSPWPLKRPTSWTAPHIRQSTANPADVSAPKRRTAVFRGKYDRDAPWLFTGPEGTAPRIACWFRAESWLSDGVAGGVAGGVAAGGVAGGGVAVEAAQKPRSL